MEDTTMGDDTHTGNPPTERPSMDNSSVAVNGAISTVATDTPKDEGSDFYNTPLNVGSSLQPGNAVPSNNGTIATEESGRPRIMIPGLTLLSEEDHRNSSNQQLGSVSKPSPNTVGQVPETTNRVDTVMSEGGIEAPNENPTESVNPLDRESTDAIPDASLSAEAEIAALAAEMIEGIPPATEGEQQSDGGDQPEWEVDSSPYESSSESSTDSDSSDSDEDDDDDYELLGPEEQARLLMAAEGGSDDEAGDSGRAVITEVRTANEKPDEIVPMPDITITPEMKPLRGLKGSDASNLHDEEVGDDQIEFSDDEAEAEYKRQLKLKRQGKREGKSERGGGNRGKGPSHPPSNLRHSELNYDDNGTSNDNSAEHGWYRRLARPQDLHELMGGEAPMEMPHTPDKYGERSFRGGRGRGRGKGHDRGGRGGRGGRGDRMW
ncbi:hypothetical protein TEQG_08139 [Trichophyton equinum CBS 127.97]|uniref:Uncharacterized protein n=1 Tax=Trichophyton equinum (strain ATCC MYA-4606 / CBS 127.97) TaxID=559882 RepID=F2Q4K5_TRIEC|nr:hypothetical protein TEQG_08139 [Trichophyton equinum CBS 127.97]